MQHATYTSKEIYTLIDVPYFFLLWTQLYQIHLRYTLVPTGRSKEPTFLCAMLCAMGCAPLEKFFGPTRPFFPEDARAQVGTSRYLGRWSFFAVRIIFTLFILATLVVLIANPSGYNLTYVTNWSYTVYLVSLIMLTVCTAIPDAAIVNVISKITLPLYFTAATAAFMITPVFWIMLFKPPLTYRTVCVHGGTLLVFLLDLMAGSNVRFTIQQTVFPVGMFLLYLAFLWMRYAVWRNHPDFFWPYGFIDPQTYNGNFGVLFGVYVGFATFTFVSAIVVILLNRLFTTCSPNKKTSTFEEEENQQSSDNLA